MSEFVEDGDIAIKKVADYARALGMHGVLILSPVCAKCGYAHDFRMLSDMQETNPDDPENVVRLLERFAVIAERVPGMDVDEIRDH